MAKGAQIRLFHATTAGALPPAGSLTEGELALDALSDPPHLYTMRGAARIDLLESASLDVALDDLTGATGTATGWLNRNATGNWLLSDPHGLFLPINNPTFTGTITGPMAVINGNLNVNGVTTLTGPATGLGLRVMAGANEIFNTERIAGYSLTTFTSDIQAPSIVATSIVYGAGGVYSQGQTGGYLALLSGTPQEYFLVTSARADFDVPVWFVPRPTPSGAAHASGVLYFDGTTQRLMLFASGAWHAIEMT